MRVCVLRSLTQSRGFAAGFTLLVAASFGSAWAEPRAAKPTEGRAETAASPEAQKAQRQKALETLRAELKRAAAIEAKLKAEIASIGEHRRELNKALIDTASRIRETEGRVTAGEERLKELNDNERTISASLDARRSVIAEVLAALQRMGRRPPPALMVRPDDALEAVRGAILLGAVVPEMRAETQALLTDLAEFVRVRNEIIVEREQSARDILALSLERQRMNLLVEERQKRQTEAEQALQAESRRAADLARQADNLQDLIAKLEKEIAGSARAAQAAKASKEPRSPAQDLAALKDPGRLTPAIAFASAKGMLSLPVNGVKIRDFGEPDRFGGVEKGLSIATRASAQVTAPCDGWVVYAGPFRSYGQLLILNAGGGYHVLLAGMEQISVDLGQFVLTGEPVAVMGGAPQSASLVAIGSSQPVLYVEFRKDGSPVDPSPWWAKNGSEKVRG
jgi:septal ring factor EnvC (AmiA/AmiB activator)